MADETAAEADTQGQRATTTVAAAAVENTQWATAATATDETATETDTQGAPAADEIATDEHAMSVAVEYTHNWATAGTMAEETAIEADTKWTTVADAQHNTQWATMAE